MSEPQTPPVGEANDRRISPSHSIEVTAPDLSRRVIVGTAGSEELAPSDSLQVGSGSRPLFPYAEGRDEEIDSMSPLHDFPPEARSHRRGSFQSKMYAPRSSLAEPDGSFVTKSESFNEDGRIVQGEVNVRLLYTKSKLEIVLVGCNILGPRLDPSTCLDLYCKVKLRECPSPGHHHGTHRKKVTGPMAKCDVRDVAEVIASCPKEHSNTLRPDSRRGSGNTRRASSANGDEAGMLFGAHWDWEFSFDVTNPLVCEKGYAVLEIMVYVKGDSTLLGSCNIPLDGLLENIPLDGFYPLMSTKRRGSFSMLQSTSKSVIQQRLLSVVGRIVKNRDGETVKEFEYAKGGKKAPFRKIVSIRTVFVCLIAIQLVVAIAVTTSLTYIAARDELENSAKELVSSTADSIYAELQTFFGGPPMNVLGINQNPLAKAFDLNQYNQSLLYEFGSMNESRANTLSSVEALFYGSADNRMTSVNSENASYADTTLAQQAKLRRYAITKVCETWQTSCVLYDPQSTAYEQPYNVSTRDWYILGKASTSMGWTDPYLFANGRGFGITAYQQARQTDTGAFNGVVGGDLALEAISMFLSEQQYYKTGLGYLVQISNGTIFASSDNSAEIQYQYVFANHSENGAIRKSASFLETTSFDECGGPDNTTCVWLTAANNITYFANDDVVYCRLFKDSLGLNLAIVIVIPFDDFTESFNEMMYIAASVGVALLFLSIAISIFMVNEFTRELVLATKQLRKFASLEFSENDYTSGLNSPIKEISRIYYALTNMRSSLKSFTKYVPADVVRGLVKDNQVAKIGGERRILSILFSDIVNFTRISEELTLDELITIMGEYLDEMSIIIKEHEGTVDKYIGDAIMALWNAPELVDDHAVKACAAAIEYQRRLKIFSDDWVVKGYPAIKARIGIHTGEAIVGNFGAKERLNYTALGDNVNLGSRLEALNKEYGTNIMISEDTYREVMDKFLCRPLDMVAVKGKVHPSVVFELVCHVESASVKQIEDVRLFARALESLKSKDVSLALSLFESYLKEHPRDKGALLHIHTCKNLLANGIPEEWNGVRIMDTK
eukprot:Nk52_evm39s2367 gene=Nk52_evmTU39s2367